MVHSILGDGVICLILPCSVLIDGLLGRLGEERLVIVEVVGMSWVLPGVNVTCIGHMMGSRWSLLA